MLPEAKRRIGIIGFGQLGQFLVENILSRDDVTLAFVWNRNIETLRGRVDESFIIESLDDIHHRFPDLVVEVAHPSITLQYATHILQISDYMIGSPTVLADEMLLESLKSAAIKHSVYIPCGALWGAEDIKRMADRRMLERLCVTMTFHPDSLKLVGELQQKNDSVTDRTVLYQGPVRQLCHLAPNNVNTMAAAAIVAHTLGFDGVEGCLIADPAASDWHIIEISVDGKRHAETGLALNVSTTRRNPARKGQVTGFATRSAFLSSLLGAFGKGPGFHLC